MGSVYLVRHNVLDTEFALKVLSPNVASGTGSFVRRFIREAKLSSRIHHPNLVAVHDAGYEPTAKLYYLVMDYVPGGTLRERLNANPCGLPPEQAVRIVGEIAAALASSAEMKLVHRDIKPENIMFDEQGRARLADLGIAKAIGNDDSLVTMANAVFGTPAYMSPEQARDSGKVDARTDIYSLGVVFYEMLCGKRPYKEGASINVIVQVLSSAPIPDIRSCRAEVPESVAKVLADMCEKDVRRRIGSASELLKRLAGLPGFVAVPVVPITESPRRQSRWGSIAALLAGAILVCGIYEWRHVNVDDKVNVDAADKANVDAGDKVNPPEKADVARHDEGIEERVSPPDESPALTSRPQTVKPAPVSRYPRVPVKVQAEQPPSGSPTENPLKSGSVVVLGDGSDVSAAYGRHHAASGSPLAVLEAENPARLMRQIDDVIAHNPKHVYLKLVGAAKARSLSPENFETSLFAVADRLRDKNVPFTCVVDPETNDTAPYNAVVREVCKLRSYEYEKVEAQDK